MTLAAAEHRNGDLPEPGVEPEDELRAHFHALLSRLLGAPPDARLLSMIAACTAGETPLGKAVANLSTLSGQCLQDASRLEEARQAHHNLLIGLGRGELIPYGSYYMTGFMHEKPLAQLRRDMARLGIARDPAVREPEDHISILCETMSGLILGRFGRAATLVEQRDFFARHIAPWAGHFFRDLEAAKSAGLYAAVGALGREFIALEERMFALVVGTLSSSRGTTDNPGGTS